MRWLSANWIWLVVVGGMLWMHLGMHRGHGGHGGHEGHTGSRAPQERASSTGHGSHQQEGPPPEAEATTGGSHRHRGC